jgi:hypothetical protein
MQPWPLATWLLHLTAQQQLQPVANQGPRWYCQGGWLGLLLQLATENEPLLLQQPRQPQQVATQMTLQLATRPQKRVAMQQPQLPLLLLTQQLSTQPAQQVVAHQQLLLQGMTQHQLGQMAASWLMQQPQQVAVQEHLQYTPQYTPQQP